MAQDDQFKKLIAHAKEYGYIFQSSEIYDGLAAAYDYGQYGVELKNNIKNYLVSAVEKENFINYDELLKILIAEKIDLIVLAGFLKKIPESSKILPFDEILPDRKSPGYSSGKFHQTFCQPILTDQNSTK